MRKFDIISGVFLLLVSLFICIGSMQMEVGRLNAPGSGFYPLVTGLALGIFSIIILIQARNQTKEGVRFWAPNANKKGILSAFVIILIYAMLLERIGFLSASVLFFILVSRFMSGHSWKTAVFFALVASFATYGVFKFLLNAPLPQGILEGVF